MIGYTLFDNQTRYNKGLFVIVGIISNLSNT